MPSRQDVQVSFSHLDRFGKITGLLGQATRPGTRLRPFLDQLLAACHEYWPEISRAEIYLLAADSTPQRAAGFGVPEETLAAPDPSSAASQAIARREPVSPDPASSTASWAVPLSQGATVLGAIQVDLAPGADSSGFGAGLLALAVPLSLAIDYLQTAPLTRALIFSQRLTAARTLPDIARVVADYVTGSSILVELAWFEFEDETPVRARSVALSIPESGEPAESVIAMADYPFSAALPDLQPGQTVRLEDDAARARGVPGLTLIPLVAGSGLAGVLAVGGPPLLPDELRGLHLLAGSMALLAQNRALAERAAAALDEAQAGSAILSAGDPPSLLKAVYEQFSAPPDLLSLEIIRRDAEGRPLALVTQAVIAAEGLGASGATTDIPAYHLEDVIQGLADGAPLLVNNLKTDTSLPADARGYLAERAFQAVGIFPVMVAGKLAHTVIIAHRSPHVYSAREIRLLHRLCEQIGLSVHRWELLRQTQEQAERLARQVRLLESLYETSRQISSHLASTEALHIACRSLGQAFMLAYAAVVRFDQVPISGTIAAEHPVRLGHEARIKLEGFGAYKHFQTYHAPLTIAHIAEGRDLLGAHLARFQASGVQSLLMVPLVVQGDLIGLLLLGGAEPNRAFSQEELYVAQAIAAQIAVSLRNAELFGEIQQRANQLDRIAAFGRLITSTQERGEVLRRVMDVVPNLLPAGYVSIALHSPGQGQMTAITLETGDVPQETPQPAAGTSVEEVVQTQNAMLIPDLASSTYSDHRQLAGRGLNSALIAPLVVGGRVLGAVIIGHPRARLYTPTDLTLLQQIGNQIAIALENARLLQAAQHRARYEEALNEITARLQQQTDMRDLLQQTMHDLGQTLGARRARVRLQTHPGPNGNGAHAPKNE